MLFLGSIDLVSWDIFLCIVNSVSVNIQSSKH